MLLGNRKTRKKLRIFTSALCIRTACISHSCQRTDACNFKCKSAYAVFSLYANSVYLISYLHKQVLNCMPCMHMSAECSYAQIFLKACIFYAHCLKSLSVSGGLHGCCQRFKKWLYKNG